jgi:GNAT superfamily N-acetyltransferase
MVGDQVETMSHRTRTVTTADVPAVVPLLNAAYGENPTFDSRFRTYLALQPDGWVAVDGESGLIGVGGFVAFDRCAYVGLMAVAPQAQRQGVGALIFDEILGRCSATGRGLLLLDASAPGAPLYAGRSFVDDGLSLSYVIDPKVAGALEESPGIRVDPLDPVDAKVLAEVARLDARGYGADRTALIRRVLEQFSGRAFLARDGAGDPVGYAVAQSRSFGPCVAASPAVARALLRRAMALPFEGRVSWLVPGQNAAATKLAEAVGGAPTRTWRHMRRGSGALLESDWSSLYAKASLAVG